MSFTEGYVRKRHSGAVIHEPGRHDANIGATPNERTNIQLRKFIVGGPLPGPNGALAEVLHIAFLLNRATAAHVVDAQRAALPQMTEYAERVSRGLQDAATRDDYLGAVKIAASAPRDGGGPAHSTYSH